MYNVILSKEAQKDLIKLQSANLNTKVKYLLETIRNNPFQTPPIYEKLIGNLSGYYSRRINIQHRLVYSVNKETNVIKVLRMWSHYE